MVAGGTSDSISDGLRMVKYGGVVSNVACFFTDQATVIPSDVWNHACLDKTVKAVKAVGGRLCMERLLALVSYGRMSPEKAVSHVFHGMEKIEDAMALMARRDPTVIKPIVFM
jgi:alcohol dehydrogenase (NADP+)